MRKSSSLAAALLAVTLMGASPAPRVYVGVQALLVEGAHTDIAGRQSGVAGGALLQFGVRAKRWSFHAEGIPPVSLPQPPSAYYGQATPQLGLINAAFDAATDRAAHWWLGAGMTVINQRTPLPNIDQVVTSRLAGARFELSYRRPLGVSHFIECTFGGAPHLSGSDHYAYSDGSPPVDKPEVAAEEDAMLAYGIARGNTQWLLGLRTIDFSARYSRTGLAADRNNGGGVMLEVRRFVR